MINNHCQEDFQYGMFKITSSSHRLQKVWQEFMIFAIDVEMQLQTFSEPMTVVHFILNKFHQVEDSGFYAL